MGTLHNCQVLGNLEYNTGKCRRFDKRLCNICPLKHEGKARSDGGYALRAIARMRTKHHWETWKSRMHIHIHI